MTPDKKKTVIFIHGMWCRGSVSTKLGDLLGDYCEFHSPNLPEHCDDFNPDKLKEFSFLDYVETIHDYINNLPRLEDREIILIGHSMGGLIAQKVAEQTRVAGVVLLNSVAPSGVNHITPTSFMAAIHVFRQRAIFKGVHHPRLKHALFGLFNRIEDESRSRELYQKLVPDSGRCFSEMVFWWLDRKQATRIKQPVSGRKLIICCGQDRLVRPRVADKLRKRYSDAEFRMFPNNGHWIFDEPNDHHIFQQIVNWITEPAAVHHLQPVMAKSDLNQAVQEFSR